MQPATLQVKQSAAQSIRFASSVARSSNMATMSTTHASSWRQLEHAMSW